jgi:hypothetical protein
MQRLLNLQLFLLLISVNSFSQITIDANDMPEVGDSIRISTTITTGNIDFTLTGENYNWDFSTLGFLLQEVDTFVSVWSTPLLYQLIFFYPIVATIAQPLASFDIIPEIQVTDVYNYYKETSSNFVLAGYAFTLNGVPLPLKYDDPDVYYKFPLEYGNIDSSSSAYELPIPGLVYYSTSKHRKNTVDGWGTLITPYGTFDALRVKSEIQINDSLYIDTLNIGFPINRSLTEYKWLGNGFGEPLLQVTQEGLVTTVRYIDSLRVITGIKDNKRSEFILELYPNPCTEYLNVRLILDRPEPASIEMYDPSGQKLWQKEYKWLSSGENQFIINVKGLQLSPGIYLIYIRHGNSVETRGFIME